MKRRARSGVYRLDGYEAICERGHGAWYGTPGLTREEAALQMAQHLRESHKRAPQAEERTSLPRPNHQEER